jgi:hypothetical protein
VRGVNRRRVAVTGIGAVSALGRDRRSDLGRAGRGTLRDRSRVALRHRGPRRAQRRRGPPCPARRASRPHAPQARLARGPPGRGGRRGKRSRTRASSPGRSIPAAAGLVLGAGAGGLFETEGYYLARLAHGPRRARGLARVGVLARDDDRPARGRTSASRVHDDRDDGRAASSTIAIGLAADRHPHRRLRPSSSPEGRTPSAG